MTKKKQKIYLETSVISAYYDFWKTAPQQKKEIQKFWRAALPKYGFISDVVLQEINNAEKEEWIIKFKNLIKGHELLELNTKTKLGEFYVKHNIIPASKLTDALHLSCACVYKIDYLVSWNCRHIVRPFKKNQIEQINKQHKIFTPTIAKPSDFLLNNF